MLIADSADGVLVTSRRSVDGVSVWCKQAPQAPAVALVGLSDNLYAAFDLPFLDF